MKVLSLLFCGRKVLVQDEPPQLHSTRGKTRVRGGVYRRGANNRSQGSHTAFKQPTKQKLHDEKDQSSSTDDSSEPEKKNL